MGGKVFHKIAVRLQRIGRKFLSSQFETPRRDQKNSEKKFSLFQCAGIIGTCCLHFIFGENEDDYYRTKLTRGN